MYYVIMAMNDLIGNVSQERVFRGWGIRETHKGIVSLHYTSVDYGSRPTDGVGDHLICELRIEV